MRWQQWVLVGFFVAGAIATVYSIGEPRKPITPGVAVVSLMLSAFMAWLVVTVR